MTLREVKYTAPGGGGVHAPYIPLSYAPDQWYSAWGCQMRIGTWQTNSLRAFPFLVQRLSQSWSAIGLEITTAQAGATIRLGAYRDGGGKPGALEFNAGSFDGGATGLNELAIAWTLELGVWWLAAAIDVGPSPSTLATRCWGNREGGQAGGSSPPGMPASQGVGDRSAQGWSGGALTTLPNPFPATPTLVTDYVPKIMLKAAG